jgi:hypothetical protein
MIQPATQTFGTQQIRYSNLPRPKEERPLINRATILTQREKDLHDDIDFLTQYMEDLKAGRPVDNISPSNDPYYLIPENIACMIRGEKDILEGRTTVVRSVKDIIGEWDI